MQRHVPRLVTTPVVWAGRGVSERTGIDGWTALVVQLHWTWGTARRHGGLRRCVIKAFDTGQTSDLASSRLGREGWLRSIRRLVVAQTARGRSGTETCICGWVPSPSSPVDLSCIGLPARVRREKRACWTGQESAGSRESGRRGRMQRTDVRRRERTTTRRALEGVAAGRHRKTASMCPGVPRERPGYSGYWRLQAWTPSRAACASRKRGGGWGAEFARRLATELKLAARGAGNRI